MSALGELSCRCGYVAFVLVLQILARIVILSEGRNCAVDRNLEPGVVSKMQDSLCGTKNLISRRNSKSSVDLTDPHPLPSLSEVVHSNVVEHGNSGSTSSSNEVALLQLPDTSWMDLIDELIQPPLDAMICSPLPVRSYESPTFDDDDHSYLSSLKRAKSEVFSSSPPPQFETFKDMAEMQNSYFLPDSSFLELEAFDRINDFDEEQHSNASTVSSIHKVPSASNVANNPGPAPSSSGRVTNNNLSKTKSFTAHSNTSQPLPATNTSPISRQAAGNKKKLEHASSLNSPMQGLLDQDPSRLLGTSSSSLSQGKQQPHVSGLQLVHMLLACAEAISQEEFIHAESILLQLQQFVSLKGDSIHRVAAHFTEALHARLIGAGSRSYMALRAYDPTSLEEILGAYHILYQVCPYIKFAHFTSNQAIFEAFEGEQNVHIIDLEILQGYQWPAFMQALAARQEGPPHLRITGVGMPLEAVQETGKRLTDLAHSLHVPFQYHAVGERLENVQAHMLQRRIGEALAVNSISRLHRTSPLLGVLQMIREQAPTIVTLVEQEAAHNGSFFLGRFLEALHYYSAIFDSLEATLPQTSPERAKVEQVVFAAEITNVVACEGGERIVRHEKVETWRKIMESNGFHNVPLSPSAVHQSNLLLGLYPCDGYSVVEDNGCLLLGWQDRAIIGASAWRC